MTIIAMVCIFMFAFGISWGFGAWVYIPEIMPLRVRAKGIGIATAMNWGPANVLNAILTPLLIENWIGAGGTLLVDGILSAAVLPFCMTCLPETKGRSLEEVAPLFHFSDRAGFGRFVKGNLRGGHGCEDVPR